MNRRSVCTLIALSMLASTTWANDVVVASYPAKPIKIIVPLPPEEFDRLLLVHLPRT